MAPKTDTSTAGRSDPSTVSAAALRLDPLLRKIRDGLSQYLEAFALAIQGARRQDIKWPLFTVVMPDPGDGGTIDLVQQEAGDFVGFDNFGIFRFNIPVSEADIETAASYLRYCGLDPDAQRLLEVFKGLKAAFCSVVEFVPLSDGSMANRKFYAQNRALKLSEHLEELIRTLPTIFTDCTEPLTQRAQAVYDCILAAGPVFGRQITQATGIDQSTLTKEIIPELKRLRGIVNKPGAGYYSPRHYRPQ